jgi:hypothetical protein
MPPEAIRRLIVWPAKARPRSNSGIGNHRRTFLWQHRNGPVHGLRALILPPTLTASPAFAPEKYAQDEPLPEDPDSQEHAGHLEMTLEQDRSRFLRTPDSSRQPPATTR